MQDFFQLHSDSFFSLLSNLNEGIMVHDKSGSLLYANSAAATILGFSHEELQELEGRRYDWQFIDTEHKIVPQEEHPASKLIQTQKNIEHQLLGFYKKSSELVWIDINGSITFNQEQEPMALLLFHDVTQKKREYEEVALFKELFNILDIGVIISDPHKEDNPIVYVNPGFTKTTGYSSEDVIGKNCRFLQATSEQESSLSPLREAIKSKSPYEGVIKNYKKNGELFYNLLYIAPYFEKDKLKYFIGLQHDITEQKRQEESLEQQNSELQELHAELLQKNQQLKLSADIAGIAYWEFDIKKRNFTLNDEYFALLGTSIEREGSYTLDLQSYFERFLPQESQESIEEALRLTSLNHEDYSKTFKYKMRKADGDYICVLVKYFVTYDAKEEPTLAFGSLYDISAQEKYEEKLLEKQRQASGLAQEQKVLLSLFEKGDSVLFKWRDDSNWSIAYVSHSVERLLGFTPEAFISGEQSYASFVHPDDLAQVVEELKVAIKENREYFKHKPYRVIAQDGTIKWVLDYSVVQRDAEGNILHFLGYISDITDSKAKEFELATLNVKLSSIMQTIYDTLYTLDMQGIIQTVNPAITQLLGYTEEELLGKSAHELFHYECINDRVVTANECSILHAIETDRSYVGEQVFRKKDGSFIDVEVASNPLYIDKKIVGSVTVCRDISLRKETLRLLQEAKESAEESNRAKSDFLANMSHEIRTPMNAVLGLSKLLIDTPLEERQKNYAQNIHSSSNALLTILNEILDFSKIEANRLEIENYAFETKELLDQVNTLFSTAASQKGLELVFDIEPNVPAIITSDKMRISQVIGNLVGNAIKFTHQGEIHIRIDTLFEQGRRYFEVYIRDTGIGIDSQSVERLFEPFTQADTSTTRKYGGTGLGLVISKKLIELMGGSINVKSTLGSGSTFSFKIPISNEQNSPIHTNFVHKLQGMKTLVIDDLQSSVVAIEKMLSSLGFDVKATTSSLEAYELFHQAYLDKEPFELIISDWKMPELDGLSLAQKIDECCEQNQKTPMLIMLTAFDREQFLAQENSELAYAVLNKPATPSTLFNTIIDIQYGREATTLEPQKSEESDYMHYMAPLKGAKVLLVEDNATNRIVAKGFLEKLGIEIVVAQDGLEALQKERESAFDAILMDIQMPNMNGLQATRELRKRGSKKPIIAMTAAAMESDKKEAQEAGMNAHISKPIDDKELAFILLKHLDKAAFEAMQSSSSTQTKERSRGDESAYTLALVKEHLHNDKALVENSLSAFSYDLQSIDDAFSKALAQEDIASLKALAHKLKGAAGNLKALKLYRLAQEYEADLNHLEDASATLLLQELQSVHQATKKFLAELQEREVKVQKVELTLLAKTLQNLSQIFQKHGLVGEKSLQELRQCGIQSTLSEKLLQEINAFDYQKAQESLADIAKKYGVKYE